LRNCRIRRVSTESNGFNHAFRERGVSVSATLRAVAWLRVLVDPSPSALHSSRWIGCRRSLTRSTVCWQVWRRPDQHLKSG
jgi:hypothetical protein